LSCLVLAVLLTGCPKRPVATVASAPAPVAPPPAPAPPPPAPPEPAPPPAVAAPTPAPAPPPVAVAPPPAPAPAPPPPPAEFMPNAALKDVYFDFDKSNIRPGDAQILDASATYLKANPNQIVLIEGHCDERGTIEYNLALGERRAKAAMNYLVAQGIDALDTGLRSAPVQEAASRASSVPGPIGAAGSLVRDYGAASDMGPKIGWGGHGKGRAPVVTASSRARSSTTSRANSTGAVPPVAWSISDVRTVKRSCQSPDAGRLTSPVAWLSVNASDSARHDAESTANRFFAEWSAAWSTVGCAVCRSGS